MFKMNRWLRGVVSTLGQPRLLMGVVSNLSLSYRYLLGSINTLNNFVTSKYVTQGKC